MVTSRICLVLTSIMMIVVPLSFPRLRAIFKFTHSHRKILSVELVLLPFELVLLLFFWKNPGGIGQTAYIPGTRYSVYSSTYNEWWSNENRSCPVCRTYLKAFVTIRTKSFRNRRVRTCSASKIHFFSSKLEHLMFFSHNQISQVVSNLVHLQGHNTYQVQPQKLRVSYIDRPLSDLIYFSNSSPTTSI